VPYTEALGGSTILTPKYDSAPVIYQDLVTQLNTAIANITKGQAASATTTKVLSSADPMFAGDMNRWKRFANSLKLRLLVKMAGVASLSSFTTPQFAAFDNTIGIIVEDATVNPGYLKQAGRLAPIYSSLAANETNTRTATSVLPTRYVYAYYNGGKIQDAGRGAVVYRLYPNTATNQLGQETLASTVVPPAGSTAFYTGTDFDTPGLGAVKGPSQSQVIMLMAEARFVRAEAIARGYITGNAQTDFEAGIVASFRYLYKNQTDVVDASKTTALTTALEDYKTNNPTTYLVNYNLATTFDQRLEAIITQKYIAFNLINMDEAFAEYRRTGYPFSSTSTADPIRSFASIQSRSTSPDKLINRLPYPQSEYNVNSANVPQNVDIFTAKVFWDVN
ncbi:MAG: SusD/RagB family nutrient-binding outer membrane lipoprotein, partial [Sphingobacteriaceae bacterium]